MLTRWPTKQLAPEAKKRLFGKFTQPRKGRKAKVDPGAKEDAKQSKKARSKKASTEKTQSRRLIDPSHIFVGNLQSTITQERLQSTFTKFGPIKQTLIRVSMGCAVTGGLNVPAQVRGPRDRRYATIDFFSPIAARKALVMNGTILDGCQLVVSLSAGDLPEVRDMVDQRLSTMRAHLMPENAQGGKPAPLTLQPTEQFHDFGEAHSDRHKIFGLSFTKCVA
ncbi:hypothetical protein K443DRAFT_674042 [Laccaria amethystina LaAM-08-1]|uniref:RRM domain-containing protein n=1 Tax=Laccaria amethystina LaAM-08-1 TaxID=1095629 RepID=A0A0C9XYJ0_9AGAR|nr:hypothetical protein K443DRAFT_674042 [Laccaria amethystina LaAM-08-1]